MISQAEKINQPKTKRRLTIYQWKYEWLKICVSIFKTTQRNGTLKNYVRTICLIFLTTKPILAQNLNSSHFQHSIADCFGFHWKSAVSL